MQCMSKFIVPADRSTNTLALWMVQGRGTVVTGRIEAGSVRVGEEVEIVGMADAARRSVVTGVEMFK